MSYYHHIKRFPGGIYLVKVNNKRTRAKFCKLEQRFSQRFVHVFLIHKNIF